MLVYQFYFRTREQNTAKVIRFFDFGYVSLRINCRRVIIDLKSLRNKKIKWPSAAKRIIIVWRIFLDYGSPHIVRFINGTLIFLETKPQFCGADVNTRKGVYGVFFVICVVICYDKAKILYYCVRWARRTHDTRLWRNFLMCIQKDQYFVPVEDIINYSAMIPSEIFYQPTRKQQELVTYKDINICSIPI